MENKEILKRWRLILGNDSDKMFASMGINNEDLSADDLLMDSALDQIYGNSGTENSAGKSGGNGMSNPMLTKWLGDLRTLFEPMEIKIIQNDAIERKGLRQLLFEPEMLDSLEPDISTGAILLMLKDQIPQKAKDNARQYIQKIVEDINRRLADDLKRSVTAALNRHEHSPIQSASALDYRMTISRNLKNYNKQLNTILPEKFYFFERAAHSASRTVILDIDQSGSMGESAIYSSVMGCILASMSSLKTHVVAFDTTVNDLTEMCSDPVDLLYGIQLGGGTNIEKSVAYCSELVQEPEKTTMFLITDLYEGGNRNGLIRRLQDLKESGVNIVVLLAISDSGKPSYDSQIAQKVADLDIPCFACPPERLPEMLSAVLKRRSFIV
ncbi:MAG: VWA domain-containing protein [Oscillospiraceae bacterium]|nr:VWA domain-containing protein [Oscillospiraceae bacterium]